MRYNDMTPKGKTIYMSGALIGITVGCLVFWNSPVQNIWTAALSGAICSFFGMLIARPFAVRASRERPKK
jgi:uncharacterized membrane protein HdeD (DUF308 family)